MDERVTLRLPADDLAYLDMFVEAGEFSNRSDAIRKAIREFIRVKAKDLQGSLEARKQLQDAMAEMEQLRGMKAELAEKMKSVEKFLRK